MNLKLHFLLVFLPFVWAGNITALAGVDGRADPEADQVIFQDPTALEWVYVPGVPAYELRPRPLAPPPRLIEEILNPQVRQLNGKLNIESIIREPDSSLVIQDLADPPSFGDEYAFAVQQARNHGMDSVPNTYFISFHGDEFPYLIYDEERVGGTRRISKGGKLLRKYAYDLIKSVGGILYACYDDLMPVVCAYIPENKISELRNKPKVNYAEAVKLVEFYAYSQVSRGAQMSMIDQRHGDDNFLSRVSNGSGVYVYIMDTGVNENDEFGTRLVRYHSQFTPCSSTPTKPGVDEAEFGSIDPDDTYSHGTKVASIIGGSTFGIADGVNLVSIKTGQGGCGIPETDVIAGFTAIKTHYNDLPEGTPAICQMSWGSSPPADGAPDLSADLRQAIENGITELINLGIIPVASAGNHNLPLPDSFIVPASISEVITVSGLNVQTGGLWGSGSLNYGHGVDIWAPTIFETNEGNSTFATSFASPAVTGAVALYLGRHPDADLEQVTNYLSNNATTGSIVYPSGKFGNGKLLHLYNFWYPLHNSTESLYLNIQYSSWDRS